MFVTLLNYIKLLYCLGVFMGRLRVPYQPDPSPRTGSDAARQVLCSRVRGLQHTVLCRNYTLDANLIRRVPASAELRTYACK